MVSGPVIAESVEVPVVNDRTQCIKCREFKLPDEMHSQDRLCQSCYEAMKARNAGKPKPKGKFDNDTKTTVQSRGLGWKDREEKPIRVVREDIYKAASADSSVVPRVKELSSDNGNGKSDIVNGSTVPEPLERIESLERTVSEQAELIALALRKIKDLEEKAASADSSVVPNVVPKKESGGLENLRDDLHGILKDRYERTKTNGIYVHSLYGPNGRVGGKLNISKVQAYRLRDACRSDKRFKVEKAENVKGNWIIKLNLFIT